MGAPLGQGEWEQRTDDIVHFQTGYKLNIYFPTYCALLAGPLRVTAYRECSILKCVHNGRSQDLFYQPAWL